jgi:hypothetical protein
LTAGAPPKGRPPALCISVIFCRDVVGAPGLEPGIRRLRVSFYCKDNNDLDVKPAKNGHSKSIGYEQIVKRDFVCSDVQARRY